jgi:hypothetical protein
MSQYLERAAELLKKVVDYNERNSSEYERNEGRLKISTYYAALAAIDKGLLPQHLADDLYGQLSINR